MSRVTLFCAYLVGLLLFGHPQLLKAQTEPLPIEQFWERLGALQLALINEPTAAELARFADELEQESVYMLENGRLANITPQSLIFALRQEEPDLEVITAQIDALATAREAWPPSTFGDAELAQLQQIFANPQFDYSPPTPNPIQEFLSDLWLRIREFMERIIPQSRGGSELFSLILTYAGIIGFVIVMGSALFSLYRSFTDEASGIGSLAEEAAYLTADSALDQAQQYSNDGDYRTAVRYLYLSALLLLEEQGLLRYDRAMTNREYLRSIAHKPELATILRNVIDVFDRVWYGFQPLAAAEYNEYVKQVDVLKQQRSKK